MVQQFQRAANNRFENFQKKRSPYYFLFNISIDCGDCTAKCGLSRKHGNKGDQTPDSP